MEFKPLLCAFLFLCSLSIAYSADAKLVCTPSGSNYLCTVSVAYTGPFMGETINITSFTGLDGTYTPLYPLNIAVNTTTASVGSAYLAAPYHIYNYFTDGLCASNSIDIWGDNCEYYNGTKTLNQTRVTDWCGVAGRMPPTICRFNRGAAAIGIDTAGIGQVFLGNGSYVPVFTVNTTWSINGIAGSYVGDITVAPPTTSALSIVANSVPNLSSVGSGYFPVWFFNNATATYSVPTARFYDYSLNYYLLERDPYNYLASPVPTASDFVDYSFPSEDTYGGYNTGDYRRKFFCSGIIAGCTGSSINVFRTRALTQDYLTAPPAGYVFNGKTITAVGAALGNISSTIFFSAMFARLPPSVTLTGYTANSFDKWVAIYGVNSGNAGRIGITVNYTSGPPSSPDFDIGSGTFSIRIESGMVASVCVATSCLSIIYPPSLGGPQASTIPVDLVPQTVFFDSSNRPLYVVQIVGIVVIGVLVLIMFVWIGKRWRHGKKGYTSVNGGMKDF